jgi:hypothetical protein
MKKLFTSGNDLKALAWLGLTGLVLLIALPVVLGYVALVKYTSVVGQPGLEQERAAAYNEPLGELGSRCGGPDRLPCRPGLACSTTDVKQIGKCEKSPVTGQKAAAAQLNESCGGVQAPFCVPGLYCKNSAAAGSEFKGTCKNFDATAPFISTVKIDGLQPDLGGGYRGKAESQAVINVQAVNASSVSMVLEAKEGSGAAAAASPIGAVKAAGGGKYSAVLTVKGGLNAEIVITAVSKNNETSQVKIPVAAAE